MNNTQRYEREMSYVTEVEQSYATRACSDFLGDHLWSLIDREWVCVRRTQTEYTITNQYGYVDPVRAVRMGFEIKPVDQPDSVLFVPPIIERVVEYRQDRRLLYVLLLLSLLLVLFAVL